MKNKFDWTTFKISETLERILKRNKINKFTKKNQTVVVNSLNRHLNKFKKDKTLYDFKVMFDVNDKNILHLYLRDPRSVNIQYARIEVLDK